MCRLMHQTDRGFGHCAVMGINHSNNFTKISRIESHFMESIVVNDKNALTIKSNSRLKWIDIAHEPRPEIAEAPLCGNNPTYMVVSKSHALYPRTIPKYAIFDTRGHYHRCSGKSRDPFTQENRYFTTNLTKHNNRFLHINLESKCLKNNQKILKSIQSFIGLQV